MHRLVFISSSYGELQPGSVPVALLQVMDNAEGDPVELEKIVITSISEASLLEILDGTIFHCDVADEDYLESELYTIFNTKYLKSLGYKMDLNLDEFKSLCR